MFEAAPAAPARFRTRGENNDTRKKPGRETGKYGQPLRNKELAEAQLLDPLRELCYAQPGTAVFSILPLNMGQTYVQVYCEQTDPFTVRVFEIGMQISVSETLEITVEKTEQKEYDGIAAMGEDGNYPIQWWTNADGVVNLLITEENDVGWEAVDYDPDSIEVTGPFYRQGSCGFEIRGKQVGTVSLAIYDGVSEAIRLELKVNEELAAEITSFAVDAYTFDRSEEHSALETAVGRKVVLPPKATVTNYSVNSKSGSVEFLLNDVQWRWHISTDRTEAEFIDEIAAYASETKTTAAHDVALTVYSIENDAAAAVWSERGCVMGLYGDYGVTLADALAVAGQIVEENHGQ